MPTCLHISARDCSHSRSTEKCVWPAKILHEAPWRRMRIRLELNSKPARQSERGPFILPPRDRKANRLAGRVSAPPNVHTPPLLRNVKKSRPFNSLFHGDDRLRAGRPYPIQARYIHRLAIVHAAITRDETFTHTASFFQPIASEGRVGSEMRKETFGGQGSEPVHVRPRADLSPRARDSLVFVLSLHRGGNRSEHCYADRPDGRISSKSPRRALYSGCQAG